jgi:hypothetical protein
MTDNHKSFDPVRISEKKQQLLEPEALSDLEELKRIIKPKPRYIGPGPWLEILKELEDNTCRQ